MSATIAQQPALLGQLAVEAAAALINGEEVEAEQAVEVRLVTADNVSEFMSDTGGGESDAASEASSESASEAASE